MPKGSKNKQVNKTDMQFYGGKRKKETISGKITRNTTQVPEDIKHNRRKK